MKRTGTYELNLTQIEGTGDLACPRGGTEISPDDCSEEAYTIIEAKVGKVGLEEVVIRCNRCETQLHLTGFSLLQDLETAGDKRENRKEIQDLD